MVGAGELDLEWGIKRLLEHAGSAERVRLARRTAGHQHACTHLGLRRRSLRGSVGSPVAVRQVGLQGPAVEGCCMRLLPGPSGSGSGGGNSPAAASSAPCWSPVRAAWIPPLLRLVKTSANRTELAVGGGGGWARETKRAGGCKNNTAGMRWAFWCYRAAASRALSCGRWRLAGALPAA